MGTTRFAPAPTGFLHLGHVVNALYVWGWGGTRGSTVLLRVEDHDRQRARPAFERTLLDDLDWLGFSPDQFPTSAFRAGACAGRQSDRTAIYSEVASLLARDGRLYGCACTRQTLATAAGASGVYPGTCRSRELGLGDHVAWRVRIDSRRETFVDQLRGRCEQDPAAVHGDPIVRDRLGNWTYQFAVTVDDWLQGVDLVIRGEDLLSSTGLQIALGRLIGRREPAAFAHHGLVMKSATQKLSKSDDDRGVRDLRAAGWSAARVVGEAAHLAGLAPSGAELPASAAATLFPAQ